VDKTIVRSTTSSLSRRVRVPMPTRWGDMATVRDQLTNPSSLDYALDGPAAGSRQGQTRSDISKTSSTSAPGRVELKVTGLVVEVSLEGNTHGTLGQDSGFRHLPRNTQPAVLTRQHFRLELAAGLNPRVQSQPSP
jgi:hypothetical protein